MADTVSTDMQEIQSEIARFSIRDRSPLEISDLVVKIIETYKMRRSHLASMLDMDPNTLSQYYLLKDITPEVRVELERSGARLALNALSDIRKMRGVDAQMNMLQLKIAKLPYNRR